MIVHQQSRSTWMHLVYNQIYMYETELCTLCDLNVNGDEYHYIMICPYFRQRRELYLKHHFYTRPNMLIFSQLFPLKTNVHCPGWQN